MKNKFRAWDTKYKTWAKHPYPIGLQHDVNRFGWDHENGLFVIQQYTGLTDKNGTEIAIGDIIQDIFKSHPPCVVEYGDGMIVAGGSWLNAWRASLCEVIGNVYEHPLLIGGKSNGT